MGNLSDKLLCDKVDLYSKREGGRVSAHKSVCVSGFCSKCSHKQDRFFGCPRNHGDAQRQLVPPLRNTNTYSTADPKGRLEKCDGVCLPQLANTETP
ncbi:unnamed protein product [Laminaria digitata]